ncbi:MAG: endonuclease/exonuclease/phosphatase family protein [Kiritimatiellaeota bacterium]|nr:endonuclease/exonuclease/phosphatase family protein [Kiritimatiellota bacterium]
MRFLSYNIQYGSGRLRRFAWLGFMARTTRHFPTVQRFVKCVDADVVGLVEVDAGSYRTGGRNQAEALASELGYAAVFRNKYAEGSVIGKHLPVLKQQVNAVLSRPPVVAKRFHELAHGFKRLVIEVETPEVTVFVAHLALGGRARRRQLDDLHDIIVARKKPCILSGDFNFLRGVWESRLFLKASGLASANTRGRATFPSWAPLRELDFVCHSEELKLDRFRMPNVCLSDHLPLVCDFSLR